MQRGGQRSSNANISSKGHGRTAQLPNSQDPRKITQVEDPISQTGAEGLQGGSRMEWAKTPACSATSNPETACSCNGKEKTVFIPNLLSTSQHAHPSRSSSI